MITQDGADVVERACRWAIANGYATGHAETIEDLLVEVEACVAARHRKLALDQITRLRADNERLRGALEKIASVEGEDDPSIMWPWARESARAALKEPSNG